MNSNHGDLYPSVVGRHALPQQLRPARLAPGRCDIYRARLHGGRFLEPENLAGFINTPASETDVYVAPDQFAAYGRADAVGDGDLT